MRRSLLPLLLMAVALLALGGWGCTTRPSASVSVLVATPPPPPALLEKPQEFRPLKPGNFNRAE